ncbi:MAG: DUF1826 domain-containing protein [Planctomycetota bacterium]
MTTLAHERRSVSRVRIVDDLASVVSIFEEHCNAVVLARHPDLALRESAARFARRGSAHSVFRHDLADIAPNSIARELEVSATEALAADLALWCEVVGDLTACEAVGVRLACTGHAMCPRFHVDRVLLRVVCTYSGPGTELVDGPGVPLDWRPGADESAVDAQHVVRALPMQVVLLKGEAWAGNEGAGVLHRSPAVPPGERRLVLTIDAL